MRPRVGAISHPYKPRGVKTYNARADMHKYRPCLILLPAGRSGYANTWAV